VISIRNEEDGYWLCLEPDAEGIDKPVKVATYEDTSNGAGSSAIDAKIDTVTIAKGTWRYISKTDASVSMYIDNILQTALPDTSLSTEPTCRTSHDSLRTGKGLCCFTCNSIKICSNMGNHISYLCGSCGD